MLQYTQYVRFFFVITFSHVSISSESLRSISQSKKLLASIWLCLTMCVCVRPAFSFVYFSESICFFISTIMPFFSCLHSTSEHICIRDIEKSIEIVVSVCRLHGEKKNPNATQKRMLRQIRSKTTKTKSHLKLKNEIR